ncbi:MAG TPA: glycosyltransferase family 4 protein [Bacteroidales bacterium]|nr:glycosyltransferase family 4 protein [Bacteroidales bacterium]
MKILILCSKNSGCIAPFIIEQVDALRKAGVHCEYYTVEEKGVSGYLRSYIPMKRKIKEYKPDIIHAHYGLSGLLANLQRKIPVITTYHGSDINNKKAFRFSKWSIKLSAYNIFVSNRNKIKAQTAKKSVVIPCGIDIHLFQSMDKTDVMQKLGLPENKKLILFAGSFDNEVKNPALAKAAVALLPNDVNLIELKGYLRKEVAMLMNAVDSCLMASHSEGSPQFIKEAMACNCPIVSVDVGDVKEVVDGVENCYLADYDAKDIADKLYKVLESGKRSNGREKMLEMGLDEENIAKKIISVYKKVIR